MVIATTTFRNSQNINNFKENPDFFIVLILYYIILYYIIQ
jgi:hypothetical protein